MIEALHRGMSEAGFVDGQNVTIDYPEDLTLVAVMSTEMIPRIVQENGPEWAASVLTHLASNIRSGHSQGRTRQRGGMRSHGGDATRQYRSSL
jgi:hypothetical protein